MKAGIRWVIVIVSLLCVSQISHAAEIPKVVPADKIVDGRNFGEWAAAWWQWVLSIPAKQNPIFDEKGELCGVGQSGPVWFLAGKSCTYDDDSCADSASVVRDCTVPAGKFLFFPVLNVSDALLEHRVAGEKFPQIQDLRAVTEFIIGLGREMRVEVDGKAVKEISRVSSPVFGMTLPEDNFYRAVSKPEAGPFPAGEYPTIVDAGYYVMLKPLKPGNHTLRIRGKFVGEDWEFPIDVTYNLVVSRDSQAGADTVVQKRLKEKVEKVKRLK